MILLPIAPLCCKTWYSKPYLDCFSFRRMYHSFLCSVQLMFQVRRRVPHHLQLNKIWTRLVFHSVSQLGFFHTMYRLPDVAGNDFNIFLLFHRIVLLCKNWKICCQQFYLIGKFWFQTDCFRDFPFICVVSQRHLSNHLLWWIFKNVQMDSFTQRKISLYREVSPLLKWLNNILYFIKNISLNLNAKKKQKKYQQFHCYGQERIHRNQ